MSKSKSENPKPEQPDSQQATSSEFDISYAGQSRMVSDGEVPRLALFGNLNRDPVSFDAIVKDPLRFRDALAALYAVVGSDYRYVPKDRTAYHAYRRMKSQSANLGAWQAQQAYFDWLARNDPHAFLILDPVISVHPDKLFLEVFSKDEGTYANLSVSMDAFDVQGKTVCGTTNIDFSPSLFEAIEQFRSYRESRLTIGHQAVEVATEGQETALEKKIRVPDSWLRGFLQVQSSAMLPMSKFSLDPMDLYNVLRQLRMNKDQKGKRRGLRIELVPGEPPRIVMEPWEKVIHCGGEVYQGKQPKVVRVWGRRRLMLLRRLLPQVEQVEVQLLGSGLPSFWILRAGPMTFTLGMTGFTASNWSQAVNFDLLLPRSSSDGSKSADSSLKKIIKSLTKDFRLDRSGLEKSTKLKDESLSEELQRGCQHGQLIYDVADEVYRLRPLTDEPLDTDRLEFRNQHQRQAYDLVLRQSSVSITKENRIFGRGLELTGIAKVAADRREYQPELLITEEGFVSKAQCTCSMFRQQGLKAGPCPHLIALRIAYAIRERARKAGEKVDGAIEVETKTLSSRKQDVETTYQISLERRRLKVRWGSAGEEMRLMQFHFPDVDTARSEYLNRVDELLEKGFLDVG